MASSVTPQVCFDIRNFARERCVPDFVWLMLRRNERTPTGEMSFPQKMQILKALQ